MWASAHVQKMNIPVSMVTAADTQRFFYIYIFLENFHAEVPDNGGPDNGGSTVIKRFSKMAS